MTLYSLPSLLFLAWLHSGQCSQTRPKVLCAAFMMLTSLMRVAVIMEVISLRNPSQGGFAGSDDS